jgi:Epoxide hydrolase N terminus
MPPRPASTTGVRPFRVEVPDEAITDLRRRISATRWPDRETVADNSQGVQLATIQELARLPASRGDRKWFRDGRSVITLRVQEFDKGRGPVGLPPIG